MAERQATCKERVTEAARSQLTTLRELWAAWDSGERENDGATPDGERLEEYGLCFDYVAPATFDGQRRGFFRYQISTGGPGDEYRFFCDELCNVTRVEYWFLDWFDGAHRTYKSGPAFDFLCELFDWLTGGEAASMVERATD
jgi:hypothetical protein